VTVEYGWFRRLYDDLLDQAGPDERGRLLGQA
jgi:hypothetical protein